MAAALFSSNGEEAIGRNIDIGQVDIQSSPEKDLGEFYEIEKTVEFIQRNAAQKVALQFPDDLLLDSVKVARKLEEATGAKTYILGDTSYGSCCVDEVAAEHVKANVLVHYGRACLSPCCRLPVSYVFGRKAVNMDLCAEAFLSHYRDTESHVVVLSDVVYDHALGELAKRIRSAYPNVIFSKLTSCGETASPDEIVKFGRRFSPDLRLWPESYGIFYVGGEGSTLNNLMLTWPRCSFFSFNPFTGEGRTEGLHVNRALMIRFYLIERARDAHVFGILVGTLGVSDYLSALKHLKNIIHLAGKKSYMFSVGKLNPAKLANFPEIDVFVLVACPENSLLDSSEFYKPVVTPDEMEIACNPAREWHGYCITNFRELLPGGSAYVEFPETDPSDAHHTDVSLITGNLRSSHLTVAETLEKDSDTSLVQRNSKTALAQMSSAASYLASRSWQGLDKALGQTPVVKAVEGRKGIAIAYEDEICS
ncbi:2-(3-amino-3-carboxypropyl)histidine synthase subunit 2 [Xenopus laevis]|uniref:2-(3-amino-3-carboxypropyl)histidine synthase subunit 2 n=1 Tax=Xenopus laevis TaxID=8355 RepID=DPH2_XENLA|nr:2-(3-amino-3-carboxypropyl)histidine synthase subunit 2 [Xenopus laevis]Q6DE00.1 RecName: Full=2-(3-amino-3-carboxypropyl)histidine synthase subunit 2; AltName: Full=Diphthamide biosynthesis protein 2; AltName: Full=Diphtheria toxin resistance protein 2; AltName: Full=S-adenosyl-L-methionine:L-histidine 3-amino-3-carboxypropyltransferase 2 [Xenopus laevis]AAH77348.1 MGC81125 protein [Xenopus laevis]